MMPMSFSPEADRLVGRIVKEMFAPLPRGLTSADMDALLAESRRNQLVSEAPARLRVVTGHEPTHEFLQGVFAPEA